MKQLLFFAFTFITVTTNAQDKYNYVHFNKFTVVKGTEFVIASIENLGKMSETKSRYLLFINTKNGETNQVDFPPDASIGNLEQVKLDTLDLDIHVILVSARTIDLDGKNGIDWSDPTQIFVLSTDGKQKTQLTDSMFFTRTWTINKLTGTIVIAGYYDTNNNNKLDKKDKSEILLFDLKTLKLIRKI